MLDIIPLLIFGTIWLLSAFFEYCRYMYMWQLKEYRLDMFLDFVSTKQGVDFIFFRPTLFLRSFLGCMFLLSMLFSFGGSVLFYGILFLLFLDVLYGFFQIYKSQFRRPVITHKVLVLLVGCFFADMVCVWFFVQGGVYFFLILLLRFFLASLLVFFSYIPTKLLKSCVIFLAKRKMKKYPKLLVVGVTGSYGKTSVKEFLGHVLGVSKKVVTTPKNINTDIGIARFVLATDFSNYDVFVCEMGAYKIGEIAIVCDMVKPVIGVLTAINEQHASLFGGITQTQKAKYELLRAIPETGLVVTNADNPYCVGLLDTLPCKTIQTFGTNDASTVSCRILEVKSSLTGTSCVLGLSEGCKVSMRMPIIGGHHAFNMAPVVLVARYIGISVSEIETQARTLPTMVHGSLSVFSYGRAVIINDSYNSNPNGFRSALDVLAQFPANKRRIVITRGMLELGSRSEEIHEEIGGEISFVADGLVVITKDFFAPLKRGVVEKYYTQISLKTDPQDLLLYLRTLKEKEVVILLENRMPSCVMKELGVI